MILAYVFQRPMAVVGVVFFFMGSLFFLLSPLDSGYIPWAGGMMVAGLCLFLLAKKHPSAELIHRYYQALEKQEYEMAFQYLSPKMQITPVRFLQDEQAADTAQGPVTSYRVINVGINSSFRSGHASFTVKVKRHEQWYRVHPYVVREGKQWKIRRFDKARAIVNNS